MCLSHLIYTVRPCLIHTCHAATIPCSDHAVLLKATAQHGCLSTAALCCGLERNGMVGVWNGRGMTSVNQTRPHCVNRMRKTHSKPLAARYGRGRACYVWIGLHCPFGTGNALSLKMGPIGCSETPLSDYKTKLLKAPKVRRSQINCRGSPKSLTHLWLLRLFYTFTF